MKYIFLACKALVCMSTSMVLGAGLMLLVDGAFMRGIGYVPNNPGGLAHDFFIAYVLGIACLWLYAVYNWRLITESRKEAQDEAYYAELAADEGVVEAQEKALRAELRTREFLAGLRKSMDDNPQGVEDLVEALNLNGKVA